MKKRKRKYIEIEVGFSKGFFFPRRFLKLSYDNVSLLIRLVIF